MISISMLHFMLLCIVFLVLLNCLSVLSCYSLSFLKTSILNSLLGKSQISISLGSANGKLLCFFGGVMFPCFSMFLEVLHCCLQIWRSNQLLQSLLTGFGREIPSVNSVRNSEASSNFSYGYTCSTLLVPSSGGILKIACHLSILQSQNRCW